MGAEQIGLVEGGIDLVWIETISAPELKPRSRPRAARRARVRDDELWRTGRTMMGLTRAFAGLAADFGIDERQLRGRGLGPDELGAGIHGCPPERPVIAKANCGIPSYEDGQIVYSGTVEQMSAYALLARCEYPDRQGLLQDKPGHIAAMRRRWMPTTTPISRAGDRDGAGADVRGRAADRGRAG